MPLSNTIVMDGVGGKRKKSNRPTQQYYHSSPNDIHMPEYRTTRPQDTYSQGGAGFVSTHKGNNITGGQPSPPTPTGGGVNYGGAGSGGGMSAADIAGLAYGNPGPSQANMGGTVTGDAAQNRQMLMDRVANILYPDRPEMRSGESMADHLGIVYDRDIYEDMLTKERNEMFNNMDIEYGRTMSDYLGNTAASATQLLGTMRQGDRNAMMAGANRSAGGANHLSALLGTSQEMAQGATELAHGRSDLVREREAALAAIPRDAMDMYNQMGLDLGQLSNSELGHLAVMHSAEYSSMAGLEAALRQQISGDTNHFAGLQNNLDVANVQANAQRAAAAAQAAASRSYGGSSGGSSYGGGSTGNSSNDQEIAALHAALQYAPDEESARLIWDKIARLGGMENIDLARNNANRNRGDNPAPPQPKPQGDFSKWLDGTGDATSFLPNYSRPSHWSGR